MIQEGRVCVNGTVVTLGQSAHYGVDSITVDGKPVADKEQLIYIMLNKPRGYLTTTIDDRGRKTVMSLIRDINTRVYPVGRLDLDTEGLLLFTNDGDFSNAVQHPSFNKKKTYQVSVRGDVTRAGKLLTEPIKLNGHLVKAANVNLLSEDKNGGILEITVNEGRNRQIRRMCSICGVGVRALKRVAIGTLELGTLETGKWRYLSREEVQSLG
jgi:23S rRNA pseudouridine2605 synthase